ncbi:hypothetical protein IFM89_026809, partial [Coptis chinensis]
RFPQKALSFLPLFIPFSRRNQTKKKLGLSVAVPTSVETKQVGKNNSSDDSPVVLPTNDSSEELLRIRHTCAYVMAMAVQKLFPEAKVTIGPWIDNGFYYDFDMEPLSDKDLKKIKKEIDRIINRNLPLVREEISRDEAEKRISAINEPYKMEILDRINQDPITIYHIGNEWWDLCAGPHVDSTGKINKKAIELESIAGAYWRGDENNQMLQRIYGTAWETEEQLRAYLHFKEEAKRRDHRRIGLDLDLFSIQVVALVLLLQLWLITCFPSLPIRSRGLCYCYVIKHICTFYSLQDDAHIFCLEDQIKDEIRGVLDLTEEILLQFGFNKYEVNLSTRPEKSVGGNDIWEKATRALRDALEDKGWDYQIDEGGGAFYGPKIDLKIEDALGRKWQCSTVQVCYSSQRAREISIASEQGRRVIVVTFSLVWEGKEEAPIMIHRADTWILELFGVPYRALCGDFPLWFSPIQTRVLPVTDTQLEYCNQVTRTLKDNGIRAEVSHVERLPKLIRNAEKLKIPLMAVVGPKEVDTHSVTVRSRFGGELGTMSIDDFVSRIKFAIENRISL